MAVADRGLEKYNNFIAYFALNSRRLLKCVYIVHPITCIQSVIDGTTPPEAFKDLAEQFHKDWPHLILVGCRFGYSYLIHLDLTIDDTTNDDAEESLLNSETRTSRAKPVRCIKTIPLSSKKL